MRSSIRALFFLCSFQYLIVAVIARAQVDPTKVLIGRWEGTVALPKDNARTIIIKSVKPKADGGWIAQGNFGITGKRLAPMTYNVSLQNGEVILEFVNTYAQGKNPGRLKLVGDRKLEGWINYVAGAGITKNHTFTLEKVDDPK
jgi:hypothetical protein